MNAKILNWAAFFAFSALIIQSGVMLWDRFNGNGEAMTYYIPDTDSTCIVGKEDGHHVLHERRGASQ